MDLFEKKYVNITRDVTLVEIIVCNVHVGL
jgi:hypothetical protein